MNFRLVRHAMILLSINNKTLLVDPIMSEKGSLEPVEGVVNQNRNPLVEISVPLDTLSSCDAILITHTHRDHFDAKAAEFLPKEKQIFCQPEDRESLINHGFKKVTAVDDQLEWEGINIARTPARHGYGVVAMKLAPVSGFVLRGPKEPSVYIAGDSVFYTATKKVLAKYKPDIVICNAGEATLSTGRPITMGIKDIAKIHEQVPSSKIVAVHMEAWNHCVLTREALGKYVSENRLQDVVLIPSDGQEICFAKLL